MTQPTASRPNLTSQDPDYFRRRYAHTWGPGCERVRWIASLLAQRGIPFLVDGFMADREDWAHDRPAERHIPDITILAS